MKTLFYCQHSIGMGHLVRTIRLAEACLRNGPVKVLSGGPVPRGLKIDPKIKVKQLPPLQINSQNELAAVRSGSSLGEIFEKRRKATTAAIQRFKPDVVVIEMFPFGRKKFASEILSLIGQARELSCAKIFSSVRDVLVTRRRDQDKYDARATAWLNENFDAVLIHSDPKLIPLSATFSCFDRIQKPAHYTGYIGSRGFWERMRRQHQVVVSAGGGRVGRDLVDVAIETWPTIKHDFGMDMLIVTGPNGETSDTHRTGRSGPRVVRMINNMSDVLARSMVSVSQCGYNTAVEVLQTRTPAVFIPYETETEDEQVRRANLLSKKGRAIVVRERSLTSDSLVRAIARSIRLKHKESQNIDLNGATRSSALIREVANCA